MYERIICLTEETTEALYLMGEEHRIVGISGYTVRPPRARKEKPKVSAFTIPSGTYPSMGEDHASVSMWNFAIGHADLPESFVYAIVDTVMTQNEKMMEIHKAAVETLPQNVDKNTIIPWHPGAVRWFRENGYEIDPALEG